MYIRMNKRAFAIFLSMFLFYDCIFENLKYEAENRFLYSLFPPGFYHTVFAQTAGQYNPCSSKGTCKKSQQSCYCDSACTGYNDCCFDVTSNNSSGPRKHPYYKQFLNCETEAFYNSYYGILMVSECPLHYNFSAISGKCRLAENIHPVSAEDGTNFRNVYCAYCHNVRQYKAWRFEYYYEGMCHPDKMKVLNANVTKKIRYVIENNCVFSFVPPSTAKIRTCLKDVTRETPDSPLCSKFQNPVVIENQVFRNAYCYNASLGNKRLLCIPPVILKFDMKRGYESLSLAGIFNIRPVLEIFGQKICIDNFNYDKTKGICVSKRCRQDQEDFCDAELIRNYKWTMSLNFVTDNIIDYTFHLRLFSFLYLSLPNERYEIRIERAQAHYRCQKNVSNSKKSCCVSTALMFFSNGIEMTTKATTSFKSKIINMEWGYIEKRNNTTITAFHMSENEDIDDACNVTGIMSRDTFAAFGKIISSVKSQITISKSRRSPTEIPKRIDGVLVISDGNASRPELKLEKWNLQFEANNENNQANLITSSLEILIIVVIGLFLRH